MAFCRRRLRRNVALSNIRFSINGTVEKSSRTHEYARILVDCLRTLNVVIFGKRSVVLTLKRVLFNVVSREDADGGGEVRRRGRRMIDDGILVSERWLTYADETLRDLMGSTQGKKAPGLFYQLRPFQQLTTWEHRWTLPGARANTLKATSLEPDNRRDYIDHSLITLFYCKPQTGIGNCFRAITRGERWEYLAGDDATRLAATTILRDVRFSEAEAVTGGDGRERIDRRLGRRIFVDCDRRSINEFNF